MTEDLCCATDEELDELREKLLATGAGSFHLRQIRDACAGLRAASRGEAQAGSAIGTQRSKNAAPSGQVDIPPWQTQKRYAGFISHAQSESAMEARYLKEQLEEVLGGVEIFLDFDNLQAQCRKGCIIKEFFQTFS